MSLPLTTPVVVHQTSDVWHCVTCEFLLHAGNYVYVVVFWFRSFVTFVLFGIEFSHAELSFMYLFFLFLFVLEGINSETVE